MTIYDDVPDLEAENERLLTQALGVEAERDIARQEIERLRAALASSASWIDRWSSHVGNCAGGLKCTCGRTAILYEANAALAIDEQDVRESDGDKEVLTGKNPSGSGVVIIEYEVGAPLVTEEHGTEAHLTGGVNGQSNTKSPGVDRGSLQQKS